ncbi:hypothetical protein [Pseudoalteromonas sp. MEBiC 03485]|uniref:hypothetical protein n=1 Tax=Pseudoalteromonas sp. MEBiC 03485 TaxID=2571103 RepID=UPI00101FB264|nr:hypothetical protein [Pseudoalteromonas sp. MEBiC 03485]RZD19846.1 hypothetical protein EVU92_17145 [Pseudoalteromonas sp. MEBiC 03485]
MGSKSRSNSSQQTNNTSTSLGVQGDNTGFMTVGDGNSYNITTTDGGLVDGLVSIWGDMAGNQSEMTTTVGNMASDAFDYGRDVNRDSLDAMQGTTADALNFGRDSLELSNALGRDSVTAMQDTTRNAMGLSYDAMNIVAGAGEGVLDFATTAMGEMGNTLKDAFTFGDGIARDSIAAQSNLARDSIAAQNYLAESTVKENSDLARGVAQLAESMHGNNTAFANNAIEANAAVVRDSNNNMADLAYYTADNASNLARDFAGSFADVTGGLAANAIAAASDAYQDAGDQTLLAHKQALQFADNASRSDGQQLAISTNETMKYIVIGLGGIAIVAMFWGRK